MFKGSYGCYQQFRRCMGADRPEFQIYSPRERTIWLERFIVETWIKYERERIFIIHKQPTQHSCQELLRTKSNTALPVWSLHLPLPVAQVRYIQGPESLEKSFWRPKRNQGFLNKQCCYQCYPWTSIISITKNMLEMQNLALYWWSSVKTPGSQCKGAPVQSLVGEVRSRMLQGVAKINE